MFFLFADLCESHREACYCFCNVARGGGGGAGEQYKLLKRNRFHPVTQPALPITRNKDCPTNEFEALQGKDRNQ